jgi:hypothetical protein
MTTSLHFARLKYFSEKFTKDKKHDDILQELKKILAKEESENIDETLDSKFTENIETEYVMINANIPEVQKLLIGESEILLHRKSRYYFVNETIWEVIKEAIFQQSREIKKKEDFFNIAEDYVKLKKYFDKKMLVFEAS